MPVAGCLTLSDAEAKTANAGIAPRIKDVCLMPITALYAALLTALFVALSVRVVAARRGSGAALGDGGNPDLLRRIRLQGNFAEYVPLALILLGLAEGLHTSVWLLHLLGLALLIGRLLHAYGVSRTNEQFAFRVTGLALTLTMLICAALTCFLTVVLPSLGVAGKLSPLG